MLRQMEAWSSYCFLHCGAQRPALLAGLIGDCLNDQDDQEGVRASCENGGRCCEANERAIPLPLRPGVIRTYDAADFGL